MIGRIKRLLEREYGIHTENIRAMTAGVGGDTFLIESGSGRFVFKTADANEMNHPEREPEICSFLERRGIAVSQFTANRSGSFITPFEPGRVSHVQKFVEGSTYAANHAPEWFMRSSPVLLGRIHNALRDYPVLPDGIGADFFRYMTPENAAESYRRSYSIAKSTGRTELLGELEFRLSVVDKVSGWSFDPGRLTCCGTHGDYTVNQIICADNEVRAVIDWTSACTHPAVWEIARSFFLAEPSCTDGGFDQSKLDDYVQGYMSVAPLTRYDTDNILRLYFYQLAVCDYYAQYLSAPESRKSEYLQQARFGTAVLRNI